MVNRLNNALEVRGAREEEGEREKERERGRERQRRARRTGRRRASEGRRFQRESCHRHRRRRRHRPPRPNSCSICDPGLGAQRTVTAATRKSEKPNGRTTPSRTPPPYTPWEPTRAVEAKDIHEMSTESPTTPIAVSLQIVYLRSPLSLPLSLAFPLAAPLAPQIGLHVGERWMEVGVTPSVRAHRHRR